MRYDVLVREEPPGRFTAIVWGLPEIRAEGGCEREAVETVRQRLRAWLATAKWVTVEEPAAPLANALLKMAGHAKDDPDFDLYLEEIRRHRQEMDDPDDPENVSQGS